MAVGDVPAQPRVGDALKQAWQNIWPHFWWLLLFGVLAGLANGLNGGTDAEPVEGFRLFFNAVGTLVAIFVGAPLNAGLVKAHLAASRGQKPTWQDLGYAFGPRYWDAVLLGLLSMLIVLGGLLLLIIPGIYWGVKLVFATQRFIEDELSAVDAIKASFADVRGRWWPVFGLVMMAVLLFIAGVLALFVGVFVAMVLIHQMFVVYWRSVTERRAAEGAGWLPVAD